MDRNVLTLFSSALSGAAFAAAQSKWVRGLRSLSSLEIKQCKTLNYGISNPLLTLTKG